MALQVGNDVILLLNDVLQVLYQLLLEGHGGVVGALHDLQLPLLAVARVTQVVVGQEQLTLGLLKGTHPIHICVMLVFFADLTKTIV